MRLRTLVTLIDSRVRLTSNGLSRPSRTTVIVTLLPGAPRSGSMPSTWAIGLPSMAMMMSPDSNPARAAGVSSIGAITFSVPSCCCSSSTPMPS